MHVTVAENFALGLNITALGMGLVFLSLILIAVVIWLLDRVFRPSEEVGVPPPVSAVAPIGAGVTVSEDSASVAAAAAAVAALQSREMVAGVVAVLKEKARLGTAPTAASDPFRAVSDGTPRDAETLYVVDIDPGPSSWKQQGRLKALEQ